MDVTAALDIAAGLVLMYLVLSLLCTNVNEFIAGIFRLRANTLQAAMQQLIDDPNLKTLFDNHGLIDGAKVAASGGAKQRTAATAATAAAAAASVVPPSIIAMLNPVEAALPKVQGALSHWWNNTSPSYPSYLSGRNVALALIGSLDPAKPVLDMDGVKAAVGALPDSNIRDTLLASIVEADGKIEKFRDSVATWFDGSMDRLSGAYKRNLQMISLIVGLLIASAFNADTLKVGNALWHDRSLAQAIAQSAPTFVKAHCATQDCQNQEASAATIQSAVDSFNGLENNLRAFAIGWTTSDPVFSCKPAPADQMLDCHQIAWLWKIAGLLVTAIALSLGAPFWFDLLQKIMNFRATGAEPKKSAAA
jgi:hypothetical protein